MLCAPALATAQQRVSLGFETPSIQEPQEQRPDEEMGTSGLFLGVIGLLGGAAIGSQIGQNECPSREVDKNCVSRHAATGALIAGTVAVPVGVHIANADRRNLPLSLAVSALTAAALFYGFRSLPGEPVAMAAFVAAPLQIISSVKIEKRK
ncbi:MAG: hypothetical protein ACT4O1_14945 [Gemmatimonadota bacterium]